MKKHKPMSYVLCCLLFTVVFHITVSANSTSLWISERRPFDLLPYVIIITLAIEALSINKIPKAGKPFKVFCVVTITNLLSFAFPYLFTYASFASDFSSGQMSGQLYSFKEMLDILPTYTIGAAYIFITIAIEIPIVYSTFKNSVQNKKLLLWTVIGANVLTTIIVAVIENILCPAPW